MDNRSNADRENETLRRIIDKQRETIVGLQEECDANNHNFMESNTSGGYIGDTILYCTKCGKSITIKR